MAYENVIVETKGPVGILTINRPKALNALNSATLMDILAGIGELTGKEVRVIVITGAGDKAFVAGADIR